MFEIDDAVHDDHLRHGGPPAETPRQTTSGSRPPCSPGEQPRGHSLTVLGVRGTSPAGARPEGPDRLAWLRTYADPGSVRRRSAARVTARWMMRAIGRTR